MNISDLTSTALQHQLKHQGLALQTGSFITRIKTDISDIATGIGLLYADYPLADECFADFHISLTSPCNYRRWIKPQVDFLFDGNRVFKPLPYNQAFPMFEWGLNWCISSHAHHCLIVHAAVVEKNGLAVILPAPPGSGKSTLCAALVNRGWRLLSDELTLLRVSDGKLIPLPRPISLKNQSVAVIRNYVQGAVISREVHDTLKGTVAHLKAPPDSVAQALEVAQPAWIIFPKYQPESPAILETVPQSRTFMRVADNSFNYSLLGVAGFNTMARLIDTCQCYDFTYSNLDDAVAIFANLTSISGQAAFADA